MAVHELNDPGDVRGKDNSLGNDRRQSIPCRQGGGAAVPIGDRAEVQSRPAMDKETRAGTRTIATVSAAIFLSVRSPGAVVYIHSPSRPL